MIRRALALFVFVAACKSESSTATPIDAAAVVVADALVTVSVDASSDAAKVIGAAERHAYTEAIKAGRAATIAKKWDDATAAFDRALAAIPDDARALSERGYAKHLAGKNESAKTDFLRAAQLLDSKDKKLGAQIEFNLGLVETALDHQGIAAGHFKASFALNPTDAAKARMTGCPVTTSTPTVKVFASIAAVRAQFPDVKELVDQKNAFVQEGDLDGHSTVFMPIDGGKFAAVEVGPMGAWRCGNFGDLTTSRVSTAWKITYQTNHAGAIQGICACEDGVACSLPNEPNAEKDPTCKCDSPICPTVCGGNNGAEGPHLEIYLDAKSGASLGQFELDYAALPNVALHVDVANKALTIAGAACP